MPDTPPDFPNSGSNFFQELYDMSPSPLFVTDVDNKKVIYCNWAFKNLLMDQDKETPDTVIAELVEEAIHPEDRTIWDNRYSTFQNLNGDEERSLELRLKTHKNDWQWFRITERVLGRAANGRVLNLGGSLQNIHEEKEGKERLQEEQRRFLNSQAIGHIGSFERNLPGDFISCSEEFCRIHGITPGPAVISTEEFISFSHPDDKETLQKAIAHTHSSGEPLDMVSRILRKDGQIRHVHRRSAIIKKNGVPSQVYGTVQDITEQVQSEKERKKLNTLLRSTEVVARTGSYEADFENNKFYFSEGLYRLFGENPEDHKTPSLEWIEARSHPGDVSTSRNIMKAAAEKRKPYNYTRRIFQKDGQMRILQVQGKAVQGDHASSTKFIGLVQDITERQQAEEEIRTSERRSKRLLKVLRNVPDPYLILTSDLYIEVASDAYLKATLSTASEIIGKHLFEAYPANPAVPEVKSVESLRASLQTVLRTKEPHRMAILQYDIPLPDGGFEEKYWSPVNTPVLDSEGNVEYLIHRVTDVTEIIKKQDDLKGLANETEMLKTSLDEIKHQAAALEENKILLQSVFDASPNSIVLYRILYDQKGDPEDFRIEIANDPTLKKIAQNRNLIGQTLTEAFPHILQTEILEKLKRTAKTGESADFETWYEGDGLQNWFYVRATRIKDYLVVTVEEITARKNAKEELLRLKDELALRAADSEDRFQALVAASSDTIYKMSPDWKIMYTLIGKRFLDDKSTASSSWIEEYIPEPHQDLVLEAIQKAIASKSMFELEHPVYDMQGKVSWTYSRAVPKLNKDGEILEWLGAASDITERKEAQERQAFFIQLNDTLQSIDDPEEIQHQAIYLLGKHLGVHRAFYGELTSAEDTMYIAPGYSRLVPPLPHVIQIPEVDSQTRKSLSSGKAYVLCDVENDLPDTSTFKQPMLAAHIKACIWVPLIVNRKISAVVSVQQSTERNWSNEDVTLVEETFKRTRGLMEKAQVEKALRESEQRFRNLVESSAEAVWETDPAGLIHSDSISWRKFTGQTYEEWVGTGWLEAIHPEDRSRAEDIWKAAIVSGENIDVEMRVKNAEGNYRWTNVKATPIVNTEGTITKWSGMNLDIHPQKMSEKALRKAKEAAEAASRAKEDFVSTMSHEIRTPLNAVIGFTNLLLEQQPREDQKENLNALSFSAQNLLSLINGILDFSKLEAGKMEPQENDFDLHHLLYSLKKAHQPLARLRKNHIHLHLDQDIPRHVATDQLKLSQVLHNLVGNAVKFTEAGQVHIKVTCDKSSADEIFLKFVIEDTGIGIPHDKVEHIFDKFSQAESTTVRGYGGTGLGLSITRLLLDLMGSDIQVESEFGKGSRFYFILPVKKASYKEPATVSVPLKEDSEEIKRRKILLVEDVEINRNIVLQFLDNWWEIQPDEAVNGKEALQKAGENMYDLILMDVRMPEMDGYEATRRIRRIPGYEEIPILALTADKSGEVQLAVQSNLFSDLLTKPFEPQDLRQRILENLSGVTQTSAKEDNDLKERINNEAENAAPAFDISRYTKIAGDHPEVLEKLLRNSLQAFREYKEEFASAAEDKSEQQLSDLVHKNTTSVYYLQATTLSRKIGEYRKMIKEEEPKSDQIKTMYQEVLHEFDRILNGLRDHL